MRLINPPLPITGFGDKNNFNSINKNINKTKESKDNSFQAKLDKCIEELNNQNKKTENR